jgi:hypothetical protein
MAGSRESLSSWLPTYTVRGGRFRRHSEGRSSAMRRMASSNVEATTE